MPNPQQTFIKYSYCFVKAAFGNAYSEGFEDHCMALQISFTLFCPGILRKLRVGPDGFLSPGHEQCRIPPTQRKNILSLHKGSSKSPRCGALGCNHVGGKHCCLMHTNHSPYSKLLQKEDTFANQSEGILQTDSGLRQRHWEEWSFFPPLYIAGLGCEVWNYVVKL